MTTSLHEILINFTNIFQSNEFPSPKQQAEQLLCDLLELTHSELYASPLRTLSTTELSQAQEWLERRLQNEPLPYISGKVNFYNCLIHVTPDVLIPRQETEILVDLIVSDLKTESLEGKILWDICCGSGCIGIALKKRFPQLTVYLVDISFPAIQLAAENAKRNHVDVKCLQGDLFFPLKNQQTDFIVCNPPYISTTEYFGLDSSVKDYEPRLALEGGVTGLEFYERLQNEISFYLRPSGKVWFEIGYQQGKAVQELFKDGKWKKEKVEKDWAGHDRFFFLENE